MAITLRLRIEQFPARHGDSSRHDTLILQLLPSGDDETDFRTARDQNDVWLAIG